MRRSSTLAVLRTPTRRIHTSLEGVSLSALDGHKRAIARTLHGSHADSSSLALLHKLDAARAHRFLEKGAVLEARQAFLEQIRVNDALLLESSHKALNSDINGVSQSCWEAVHSIEHDHKAYFALPSEIETAEAHFAVVYRGVFRHTMLHWARLLHIWRVIRSIGMEKANLSGKHSATDRPFVLTECGVAGGGCSVLMALAARLYLAEPWGVSEEPPKVISIDNFIGMPMEDETHDKRAGDGASPQAVGWGEGTCGSIGRTVSIDGLAKRFGVSEGIQCVKGNFADVLPHVFAGEDSADGGQMISHPSQPRILFAHIDADWYESTAVCLKQIFPNIVAGGIGGAQIDDFQYWDGCKKAVHAYFDGKGERPELQSIPYDGNAVYIPKK